MESKSVFFYSLSVLFEVDTEGGPERKLEGSLTTGNGRKVGDFVASLKAK